MAGRWACQICPRALRGGQGGGGGSKQEGSQSLSNLLGVVRKRGRPHGCPSLGFLLRNSEAEGKPSGERRRNMYPTPQSLVSFPVLRG